MLSIDSEVEFIKAMTLAKMRSNEENTMQTIPCPLCGIVLTSVDNLNHHVLLHHNPLSTFSSPIPATDLVLFGLDRPPPAAIGSKKYYRCKECAVDFSSFPEFQLHVKSHTPFSGQMKIRDAKCSICNAMVAPDNMADHLSSHTGEKTYRTCQLFGNAESACTTYHLVPLTAIPRSTCTIHLLEENAAEPHIPALMSGLQIMEDG